MWHLISGLSEFDIRYPLIYNYKSFFTANLPHILRVVQHVAPIRREVLRDGGPGHDGGCVASAARGRGLCRPQTPPLDHPVRAQQLRAVRGYQPGAGAAAAFVVHKMSFFEK